MAIAAVMREIVDQTAWSQVAGLAGDEPIRIGEGANQGASGTPILWNPSSARSLALLCTKGKPPPALDWCEPSRPWPLVWFADKA